MIWQTETSPASQGGEAVKKGAYIGVSDRILQPTPTQKAKMAAFIAAIFVFAEFVSGLKPA